MKLQLACRLPKQGRLALVWFTSQPLPVDPDVKGTLCVCGDPDAVALLASLDNLVIEHDDVRFTEYSEVSTTVSLPGRERSREELWPLRILVSNVSRRVFHQFVSRFVVRNQGLRVGYLAVVRRQDSDIFQAVIYGDNTLLMALHRAELLSGFDWIGP